MKQLRQEVRSTKITNNEQINNALEQDMNPEKIMEKMNQIFFIQDVQTKKRDNLCRPHRKVPDKITQGKCLNICPI